VCLAASAYSGVAVCMWIVNFSFCFCDIKGFLFCCW